MQKATFWADFVLVLARIWQKMFKRDFLQIFFRESVKNKAWTVEAIDLKFSGSVYIQISELPNKNLKKMSKSDVTVSIWRFPSI